MEKKNANVVEGQIEARNQVEERKVQEDVNTLGMFSKEYAEEVKEEGIVSPFADIQMKVNAAFVGNEQLVTDTFYKKGNEPYLQVEEAPSVFYIRNNEQLYREMNELEGFPRLILSHPNDEQYKEKYPNFYFKHVKKPETFDDIEMIFQKFDQGKLAPIFSKANKKTN